MLYRFYFIFLNGKMPDVCGVGWLFEGYDHLVEYAENKPDRKTGHICLHTQVRHMNIFTFLSMFRAIKISLYRS